MAKERLSIPMFEAFLRQVQPPKGVLSPRLDWPIAIGVFVLIASIPVGEWVVWIGAFAAWITLVFIRETRSRKIDRQPASYQANFERWKKVSRMVKLLKEHRLAKRAPAEILLALEKTARTWQEARESLHSLAITNAELAAELQANIDASMMAAAAMADPVVLHDERTSKDLKTMEEDRDLMNRLCARISHEEARIRLSTPEALTFGFDTPESVRDRLEKARIERAAAEAELDSLI